MSGISHGAKLTPITYIFGDERKTLPIPDADEDQVASILSSMRASLVKDIVSKQKELHKATGTHQDAFILFLGHVYVVRSTNAKCEKMVGEKSREMKKVLMH